MPAPYATPRSEFKGKRGREIVRVERYRNAERIERSGSAGFRVRG